MKYSLLMLLCLITILYSCKKEDNLIQAKILDAGSFSADGCGWLLEADNIQYSAVNLDSQFMKNGLQVLTAFDATGDTLFCGIGAQLHYPMVEITSMKND